MKKNLLTLLFFLLLAFPAFSQEFSLSTNFLEGAAGGTLNVDASVGISRHWSLGAGVKYNPFTFGQGSSMFFLKQRSAELGTRYWPWHVYSGWWVAGKARWQEYSEGGIVSPETSEGDRYGASISFGYSKMLTPWLNIDFGIGLWAGRATYTTYACQSCGKILDNGVKTFLLPSDFIVALSFIL